MTKLTSLDLSNNFLWLKEQHLWALSHKMPFLKTLNLFDCQGLRNVPVRSYKSWWPNLTWLNLAKVPIDLEEADLNTSIELHATHFHEVCESSLLRFLNRTYVRQTLTEAVFVDCEVSDEVFSAVTLCGQIIILAINDCSELSSSVFDRAAGTLMSLQNVTLAKLNVSTKSLTYFLSFMKLKHLSIEDSTTLTIEWVQNTLLTQESLESVSLDGCVVVKLHNGQNVVNNPHE